MVDRKRNILNGIYDIVNPYSWIIAIRNWMFDYGMIKSHEFAIPTICIGNISVGGTGKTPHTEYLIKLLKDQYQTAVLSRGYGRKSKGYILADENSDMSIIGDEPFQIKNKFKDIDVAVCEKRVTGIKNIIKDKKETEVILLDDAFQHRHVKAGLNILLIDNSRPIWQDCILPFGRLRESTDGVKRADIVIFTKCNDMTEGEKNLYRNYIKRTNDIPVFFSSIRYGKPYPLFDCLIKEITNDMEIVLVTGIANPRPLIKEVESLCNKTTTMIFPDHHNFTASDFKKIEQKFHDIKNEKRVIITTEKDATRILHHTDITDVIKENILVLPIEVEILDKEDMFNKIILNYVTENSRNS